MPEELNSRILKEDGSPGVQSVIVQLRAAVAVGLATTRTSDVYTPSSVTDRIPLPSVVPLPDSSRYSVSTRMLVLRGGSYGNRSTSLRSALRLMEVRAERSGINGLRVARTLQPGLLTPSPDQGGDGEGPDSQAGREE